MSRRVVVTAIGCMAPAAPGTQALARSLFETSGQSVGGRKMTEELAAAAKDRLPPLIKRRMSRLSTMVTLAIDEALRQTAVDLDAYRDEIGLVLGTGYGELDTTSHIFLAGVDQNMSPTLFHNSVHNAPLGYAGIITGIRGISLTVSDGHISGENALVIGAEIIQTGVGNILVVGGADERFEFPLFQDPGQGKDPGEGAGFLVIEEEEHAGKRGVKNLGTLYRWSTRAFPGDPEDIEERIGIVVEAMEDALADAPFKAPPLVFAHLPPGARETDIVMRALERTFPRGVAVWSSSHF